MLMIKLQLVDHESFEAVIALSLDEKDQRKVASNLYSLAQTWLYRERNQLEALAIWAADKVVGFLLLSKEGENWLIWRLMIDHHQQGKGYGKEALRQIMRRAIADTDCKSIQASYVVGNHKMRSILSSLGFISLGLDGNEIKMEYQLKRR